MQQVMARKKTIEVEKQGSAQAKNSNPLHRGPVDMHIVYYTDPLCCWSWAMEAPLMRLQQEWEGAIHWRYCMGGLLPGWKNYVDTANDVTRPVQMGPVWMHASRLSGVSMPHRLWMEDPPASSYPACIAVKCAGLQSAEAEKKYLHYIREALMIEGLNIAKPAVLNGVAEKLFADNPECFTLSQYQEDMQNGKAMEAFRKDIQEVRYRNINRFPTLVISRLHGPAIQVTGYKIYEALLHIIDAV
jgi:putative protein-disulfide isomerase